MPTKETSLWLISFLASPRCLVSRSQESFNSSAIFAEFSRAERMTWFDFASNIGGITGVTLGISFVSLLEVFYWVFIRFCGNLIKNKEQKMRPHMQKKQNIFVCLTLQICVYHSSKDLFSIPPNIYLLLHFANGTAARDIMIKMKENSQKVPLKENKVIFRAIQYVKDTNKKL